MENLRCGVVCVVCVAPVRVRDTRGSTSRVPAPWYSLRTRWSNRRLIRPRSDVQAPSTMLRRLADGGSTGVTFNLREFSTADCTGEPSNAADASATWYNFPVRQDFACISRSSGSGGGSLMGHHCDMTANEYKGTRYPDSTDCTGTHQAFAYPADGSCVTTEDGGSVRAECNRVHVPQASNSAVIIIAVGAAVWVCVVVLLVYWCCRRLRREARSQRDRQRARSSQAATDMVQVEPSAPVPSLPVMTSIVGPAKA